MFKESFSNYDIYCLKEKIKNHNQLYISLFKENLKPKHHILLHYPTVVLKSGPLKPMWCMRFESKHRELKYYTNAITSRRNLPLSVAKKCAIRFSYNMMMTSSESNVSVIKRSNSSTNLDNPIYEALIKEMNLDLSNIVLADHIEYKGTQYKKNYFLKSEQPLSFVLKIYQIIIHYRDVILFFEKIKVENFDKMYNCYIIGNSLQDYCWTEMNLSIHNRPFNLIKLPINGKKCFKIPII